MIKRVDSALMYCASIGGMIYTLQEYTIFHHGYFKNKEVVFDGYNYFIIGTGRVI